jgi:hypothetical protein
MLAATNSHSGAVMNDQSQTGDARPYSPLMCMLLLLTTGIVCAAAGSVI